MTNQRKNSNARSGAQQVEVDADGKFLIKGDLDFQTVPRVWRASQSLFANSQSLRIDLSGVESSNSAGLALLIEWMRFAESSNRSIEFQNLPEQMKQVAQLCGIEEKLPV